MNRKYEEVDNKLKQMEAELVRCQHINTQLKATNDDLEKKIDAQIQLQQDIMAEKDTADNEILRVHRELKKKTAETTSQKKQREKAEKVFFFIDAVLRSCV